MKKILIICFSFCFLLWGAPCQAAEKAFQEYKNPDMGITMNIPEGFKVQLRNSLLSTIYNKEDSTLILIGRAGLSLKENTLSQRRAFCRKLIEETKTLPKGTTVKSEIITLEGNPTAITVREMTTKRKDGSIYKTMQTAYSVALPTDSLVITFNYRAANKEKYAKIIPAIMSSFRWKEVWRRCSPNGYNYSYELPAEVITAPGFQPTKDHKFTAITRDLMTGIMVVKVADHPEYKYFPASFAGLTKAQQYAVIAGEKARFAKEEAEENAKRKAQGKETIYDTVLECAFTTVNGLPCLKINFDQKKSKSVSYIFAQDGNYISYDFIYDKPVAVRAEQLIARAVRSISLTKVQDKQKTGTFHHYKDKEAV